MWTKRLGPIGAGVCALLVAWAGVSWAQGTPSPQGAPAPEPEHAKINTADATPVDAGRLELEIAAAYRRAGRQWLDNWTDAPRGLAQERSAEVALTYGVMENLDVGLGLGYAEMYDRDSDPRRGGGVTDLTLGVKWRFYHNDDLKLSLAYLPGITLPFGREADENRLGPSQEFWSLDQKLALSKDWGRWTTGADVGFSLPLGWRADTRGVLESNLAVGYQLFDWLQPEVELNYAREFLRGAPDSEVIAVTAGLIMPLGERWRVSVGVQQTLSGRNADHGLNGVVSVLYRF